MIQCNQANSACMMCVISIVLVTGAFRGQAQSVKIPIAGSPGMYSHTYINNNNAVGSSVYDYNVIYMSGEMKKIRGRVMYTEASHSIRVSGKKDSVSFDQTVQVARIMPNGKEMVAIKTDSCWLFPVMKGKITIYSVWAESTPQSVDAVQVADGPIIKASDEVLLAAMSDNPEACEALRKNGAVSAVKKYNRN